VMKLSIAILLRLTKAMMLWSPLTLLDFTNQHVPDLTTQELRALIMNYGLPTMMAAMVAPTNVSLVNK
jgi:hypothetical protein